VTLATYGRILRGNRNFRLLWTAQIISELGDWFYSVSIFSLLLETTGSAQSISLAFILQTLPQCLIAPAAGVLNDRISRKKVMIFADVARAGIVLAMLLVQSREALWLLYVLLFLETVCWGLFEPGRSAVIPNICAVDDIPAANARASTTWSVNFAIGAAVGGVAAVIFGRQTVFVLNSLSFVVSALLITRMRFAEPHADNMTPLRAREFLDFTDVREGIRYIKGDRRLLMTVLVKGGIGLMGANWIILPVIGERVFPLHIGGLTAEQGGTLGMSALFASRGLGALIGAFAAAGFGGLKDPRLYRTILFGFLLAGAGYVALGAAGSIGGAVLALLIAHAGGSACWTSSTTLLQKQTEDRFRGRVFSAEFAFMTLALAGSSFIAGRLVDAGVDVQHVAVGTGMVMIVPACAWTLGNRKNTAARH